MNMWHKNRAGEANFAKRMGKFGEISAFGDHTTNFEKKFANRPRERCKGRGRVAGGTGGAAAGRGRHEAAAKSSKTSGSYSTEKQVRLAVAREAWPPTPGAATARDPASRGPW